MHERKLTARLDISSICIVATPLPLTSGWCSRHGGEKKTCFPSAEQWQAPDRRLRETSVVAFVTFFLNKWRWNSPCRPVTCCRGHHNNINTLGGWGKGEDTPTHPLFTVARPKLAPVSPAHVSTQTQRVPEEFLQTGVTEPMSTGRHLDRLPHRLAAEGTLEAPLRLLQELVIKPGHGCTARRRPSVGSAG